MDMQNNGRKDSGCPAAAGCFIAVPSVSDGPAQTVSRMYKMFEKTDTSCAEDVSKLSELFEKTEKHNAQRHSKLSELGVQNGFGVVPSVSDDPAQTVSRMSRMFEKTNTSCAEDVSKLSELFEKTEKHNAQRHSKLSESGVQNGFGVVPPVSDGPAQTVSRMSRMFEKTDTSCAQRSSKVSESGKREVREMVRQRETGKHKMPDEIIGMQRFPPAGNAILYEQPRAGPKPPPEVLL